MPRFTTGKPGIPGWVRLVKALLQYDVDRATFYDPDNPFEDPFTFGRRQEKKGADVVEFEVVNGGRGRSFEDEFFGEDELTWRFMGKIAGGAAVSPFSVLGRIARFSYATSKDVASHINQDGTLRPQDQDRSGGGMSFNPTLESEPAQAGSAASSTAAIKASGKALVSVNASRFSRTL